MTVTITEEVFAKLVGQRDERRTLLFEVSDVFLEHAADGKWSEPVRFRFVPIEGALVVMEIKTL